MKKIPVRFPPKLKFLLREEARYKSAKGGRGSAKSWTFAGSLLMRGMERPSRFLCCREFQKSIKDSVHQLLSDLIARYEMDDFYEVQNNSIIGKNGTVFGFEGLRHNITNIKSWEGADIAWVEEAQTMSKSSWDILPPTIRKDGSELWFSWNPDLEDDETWQRLVVSPPNDLIQVDMNWGDNPWFPDVLNLERLECKERDPKNYENIWEGKPKAAVEGAIFAEELRQAEEDGRITDVPYQKGFPVNTYWDLGKQAKTAIWFIQQTGATFRVIEHYSNHLKDLEHYLKFIQEKQYIYGTHYLPHDGEHDRLGMNSSIFVQVKNAFKDNQVQTVPRVKLKEHSLNAVRQVFPLCYFDKVRCAEGISALRRYAYKVDVETGKVSRNPEETGFHRDTADAFQCFAMSLQPAKEKAKMQYKPKRNYLPKI